jgi:hypothetical protein
LSRTLCNVGLSLTFRRGSQVYNSQKEDCRIEKPGEILIYSLQRLTSALLSHDGVRFGVGGSSTQKNLLCQKGVNAAYALMRFDFSADYNRGWLKLRGAATIGGNGVITETIGEMIEDPWTVESTPEQDIELLNDILKQMKDPP